MRNGFIEGFDGRMRDEVDDATNRDRRPGRLRGQSHRKERSASHPRPAAPIVHCSPCGSAHNPPKTPPAAGRKVGGRSFVPHCLGRSWSSASISARSASSRTSRPWAPRGGQGRQVADVVEEGRAHLPPRRARSPPLLSSEHRCGKQASRLSVDRTHRRGGRIWTSQEVIALLSPELALVSGGELGV